MTVERVYRRWKLVLKLLLFTFFLYKGWQDFQFIVEDVGTYLAAHPTFLDRMGILTTPYTALNILYVVIGLATLGLLVLAVVLWVVYKVWLARHPELRLVTKDELAQRNWLRAFRLSWLLSIGVLALSAVLTFLMQIIQNSRADAHLTAFEQMLPGALRGRVFLLAVTSLLASFLVFDRDRSRE